MKQHLALWLSLAMLLGCLTACKPTENPASGNDTPDAPSSSATTTVPSGGDTPSSTASSESGDGFVSSSEVTTSTTLDTTGESADSSTVQSSEETDVTATTTTTKQGGNQNSGTSSTTAKKTTVTTTVTTTTKKPVISTRKTTTTVKVTTAKPSTAATMAPPTTKKTNKTTTTTTTKPTATVPTTTARPTSGKLTPLAESKYYGRNLLKAESSKLAQAYERIVAAVKNLDKEVSFWDLNISISDAERVFQYYKDDYPQHYYLDGEATEYTYAETRIDTVYLKYSMTKSEITTTDKQIEKVVSKMLDGVYDSIPQEEREHILYGRLIRHMEYKVGSQNWRYNMYGAFIKAEGVCDAYSKAFQYLMYRAGIPCIRAFGISHNQQHAWNMVQLYGEWYNVDATWDDPVMEGVTDFVGHTYLNVTTAKLSNHHLITGLVGSGDQIISYPLPNATATKHHFYHKPETLFSKYDHDRVVALCEYALDHDNGWVGFHVSCSFDEFLQGFVADYYNLHDALADDGYFNALELRQIEYNDDAQHQLVYIHIH